MPSTLKTYYPFPAGHPYAHVTFQFHSSWYEWLMEKKILQNTKFLKKLCKLLDEDRKRRQLPDKELWFAAFQDDPRNIRVVILGQDPYPTRELINGGATNMATGYSFDVAPQFSPTGSAKTILTAIQKQYPQARIDFTSGDLTHWKGQGVFLLNKFLSVGEKQWCWVTEKGQQVQRNKPKSYPGKWNLFTDTVLRLLSEKLKHCVFILWGVDAVASEKHLDPAQHLVLKSYHPSDQGEASGGKLIRNALAANQEPAMKLFSQETHFAQANRYLSQHHRGSIDWSTIP
jgi:uracil-DNA glycosylase